MLSVARLSLYLIAGSLLVHAFHLPRTATTLNKQPGNRIRPQIPKIAIKYQLVTLLRSHDYPDVYPPNMNGAQVDYTVLEPDDPRFVDMPIPSENGPLAEAYNKHMLWRRGLSTNERARWHNWAVYRSMHDEHQADYSLQDYISQNLLHELYNQAKEEQRDNNTVQAFVMSSMGVALEAAQREEVRETMNSYYYAFNNQILGQVRSLWQQDVDVECILPGYAKARGDRAVDTLYMNLFDSTASMGWINATIASVQAYGNVALVHTVEEIGERLMPQTSSISYVTKKPTPLAAGMTLPRVLATTVLRRRNSQWRIVSHHAVRMWSSPFTNDQMEVQFSKQDAERRAARLNPHVTSKSNQPVAMKQALVEDSSPDPRAPHPLLHQQIITEAPKSLLREKTISNNHDRRKMSLAPLQEWVFLVDPIKLTEPNNSASNQTIQSKQLPKNRGKSAETGEVIDTVVVGDSQQKMTTKEREGDCDQRVDPAAPQNRQFVQALRVLHQQGSITQEEKESLLADILSSARQGKDSIVETVYEKICGPEKENTDWTLHLTDFANQCKGLLKSVYEEEMDAPDSPR